MAQQVNIVLVDDIDGSEADETVAFSLDGAKYVIDLNAKNAQKLRDALAPFIGHARRDSSSRSRRSARAGSASTASLIRAWARENGYAVPDRGRVSADIKAAYDAAH